MVSGQMDGQMDRKDGEKEDRKMTDEGTFSGNSATSAHRRKVK